jgi:hypothetical protein
MSQSNRDDNQSCAYTPRTDPPTNAWGERLERFGGRQDGVAEPCLDCGSELVDVWMNEGATAARLVCVACGRVDEPNQEGEQ